MLGFIKYDDNISAENLINQINTCIGLPNGSTYTWDTPRSYCTLGPTSAYTEFYGYVVKVDTDQMGQCLTQEQLASIIEIPTDCGICAD